MSQDRIQVKYNIELIARERGKIKRRHQSHNIFLNLGREWLSNLICYATLPAGDPPPATPVTTLEDRRIRYVSVGIGGSYGGTADATLNTHYPGTNVQTDTDPAVLRLERPVRFTSPIPASPVEPPYDAADVWVGQLQAPPEKPTTYSSRLIRVLSETDVSYGPFLTVPISEVMLHLNGIDINAPDNTGIAYDAFAPFPKTSAVAIELRWTLRALHADIPPIQKPFLGGQPDTAWCGCPVRDFLRVHQRHQRGSIRCCSSCGRAEVRGP